MIRCKVCAQQLPLEKFYPNNKSRCKECMRSAKREKDNESYRLQVHRKVTNRKCHKVYSRKRPEVIRAKNMVKEAVRKGTLVLSPYCERCGHDGSKKDGKCQRLEAHHEDYSKPYDVVRLCRKCHNARHNEIRDEQAKLSTLRKDEARFQSAEVPSG